MRREIVMNTLSDRRSTIQDQVKKNLSNEKNMLLKRARGPCEDSWAQAPCLKQITVIRI